MDVLLKAMLAPLTPYLETTDLVELSVVHEKELWLEKETEGYENVRAPELDYAYWLHLCHTLANCNNLHFDPLTQPRLSTALPQGHRFEAMVGPHVESGLSISIRLKRSLKVTLEDYGVQGDLKEQLIECVVKGKTILVSGGTSSGKTTFLNCLIQYIPRHLRILSLEDTRELNLPHANHVHYVLSRNENTPVIDYAQAIDHLLRSRPDIILTGELSIANTYPILRLLNTGHQGFMATLHANSPELALEEAIPTSIRLSGKRAEGVSTYLRKTIDLVVQLQRIGRKRCVTHLFYPKEDTLIDLTSMSQRKGLQCVIS